MNAAPGATRYIRLGDSSEPMNGIDAWLHDGVLSIVMKQPAADPVTSPTIDVEMNELLQAVAADPEVRVVVLRDAGPDFCAGINMSARSDAADQCQRGLAELPQPVVAMVRGRCTGAAFAVLDGRDIVLAADDTVFALSQVDAGQMPDGRTAHSISQLMSPRSGRYFALTGDRFDGARAERDGLISRSLPPATLEHETGVIARELAAKDALALRFTKETLRHVGSMGWEAVLSYTAAKFAELKSLQAGRPSARAAAVERFLAGQSKPGLGS